MCDTVEKNINIILPKYFARKKENEVAAEYEYKGTQMLIKGTVQSVQKRDYDFSEYKYAAIASVDVSTDPDYDAEKMENHNIVYCLFDENHLMSAAKLRSGTKASIYSSFVDDHKSTKFSIFGCTGKDVIVVDNCVVVWSDASDEFTNPDRNYISKTENAADVYLKIRNLCKSNEIAGEFASGTKVYVTGVVSKIYKTNLKYSDKEALVIYVDTSENPDINGHEMSDLGHAECYFDLEDIREVMKVVRGDKVTITGYINAEDAREKHISIMYLKECRLTSLQRMCEVL